MATSNEERQSWIQAIHGATIGGSMSNQMPSSAATITNRDYFLSQNDVSYKGDFEQFLKVQSDIKSTNSKETFMEALSTLWGSSLTVPILWIKEQELLHPTDDDDTNDGGDEGSITNDAAATTGVTTAIVNTDSLFWKDLEKLSVSINGFFIRGESGWGPERIVGALTRCILDFDKSALVAAKAQQQQDVVATTISYNQSTRITEVQAITFARDILLACNFRRRNGDCLYCVQSL
jgi:hypothetical protein